LGFFFMLAPKEGDVENNRGKPFDQEQGWGHSQDHIS
jgi:hypothetical protein